MDDPRSEYSDRRLDREFSGIDKKLDALGTIPMQVSALATQVSQMDERLGRMREDALLAEKRAEDDDTDLRAEVRRIGATVTGFLTALLVAVIAGVIVLAVVI
jgi:hypothetical protein